MILQPIILQDIDMYNKSQYKTQYLHSVVENTDYVLCSVSAAEYLGLYSGTLEEEIYVFKKNRLYKASY